MHIVLCNTGYPIKWTIDWAYSGAQNYIWEPPCLGSINKSLPSPLIHHCHLPYCWAHNLHIVYTMYYACAQCITHVQPCNVLHMCNLNCRGLKHFNGRDLLMAGCKDGRRACYGQPVERDQLCGSADSGASISRLLCSKSYAL